MALLKWNEKINVCIKLFTKLDVFPRNVFVPAKWSLLMKKNPMPWDFLHHFSFWVYSSHMIFENFTCLVLLQNYSLFCTPKDKEKRVSPFSLNKCLKYIGRFNLRKKSWGGTPLLCRLCTCYAVITKVTQDKCLLWKRKVKWWILVSFSCSSLQMKKFICLT